MLSTYKVVLVEIVEKLGYNTRVADTQPNFIQEVALVYLEPYAKVLQALAVYERAISQGANSKAAESSLKRSLVYFASSNGDDLTSMIDSTHIGANNDQLISYVIDFLTTFDPIRIYKGPQSSQILKINELNAIYLEPMIVGLRLELIKLDALLSAERLDLLSLLNSVGLAPTVEELLSRIEIKLRTLQKFAPDLVANYFLTQLRSSEFDLLRYSEQLNTELDSILIKVKQFQDTQDVGLSALPLFYVLAASSFEDLGLSDSLVNSLRYAKDVMGVGEPPLPGLLGMEHLGFAVIYHKEDVGRQKPTALDHEALASRLNQLISSGIVQESELHLFFDVKQPETFVQDARDLLVQMLSFSCERILKQEYLIVFDFLVQVLKHPQGLKHNQNAKNGTSELIRALNKLLLDGSFESQSDLAVMFYALRTSASLGRAKYMDLPTIGNQTFIDKSIEPLAAIVRASGTRKSRLCP